MRKISIDYLAQNKFSSKKQKTKKEARWHKARARLRPITSPNRIAKECLMANFSRKKASEILEGTVVMATRKMVGVLCSDLTLLWIDLQEHKQLSYRKWKENDLVWACFTRSWPSFKASYLVSKDDCPHREDLPEDIFQHTEEPKNHDWVRDFEDDSSEVLSA